MASLKLAVCLRNGSLNKVSYTHGTSEFVKGLDLTTDGKKTDLQCNLVPTPPDHLYVRPSLIELSLVAYGWYSQVSNQRLAVLNGLKYSVWTSRGAGLVLAFDGGLILVPGPLPLYSWRYLLTAVLRNLIRFVRPIVRWLLPADENIWVGHH